MAGFAEGFEGFQDFVDALDAGFGGAAECFGDFLGRCAAGVAGERSLNRTGLLGRYLGRLTP